MVSFHTMVYPEVTEEEREAMEQLSIQMLDAADKALDVQVGGNHYKDLKIQPVEYIHANGIGYFEGNVIKYVSRWRAKGGIKDLEKARHYLDLLIQLEARNTK